jgi:hypothetical protein
MKPHPRSILLPIPILLLTLCAIPIHAAKPIHSNWKRFIPEGFQLVRSVEGDLNGDGKKDIAIVAETIEMMDSDHALIPTTDPAFSFGGLRRVLLILWKVDGGYELASESYNAIMCTGCGGAWGDPFESISIRKGVLTVKHFGGSAWRWSDVRRFRFQDSAFRLIGRTSWSGNIDTCIKYNMSAETFYEDINFLTGERKFERLSFLCTDHVKGHNRIPIPKRLPTIEENTLARKD